MCLQIEAPTFFCKSLVFGIVDADSFRYFGLLHDPHIKFAITYLRPKVIHYNRPDQILLIPWEDIHDLSQILYITGTDSNARGWSKRPRSNKSV